MTGQLLPCRLIANDTVGVEAFSSFVHRNAYNHGVTVGIFLSYFISSVDNTEVKKAIPRKMSPQYLILPSQTTEILTDRIYEVCRADCTKGTLWFIQKLLGHSRGCVSPSFRWCPECLAEMDRFGDTVYYKLFWQLTGIKACPSHRTPLVNSCEHCGSTQAKYTRNVSLLYCQDCENNLSVRQKLLSKKQVSKSWALAGSDLYDLIYDLSVVNPASIPTQGLKKSMNEILDYYWKYDREKELYSVIPRDTLISITAGEAKPSLEIARKVSASLGISLFDMLTGNSAASHNILPLNDFCKLPCDLKLKKPQIDICRNEFITALSEYLLDCRTPPALNDISIALNVPVSYMQYRFPSLSVLLFDKHLRYLKQYSENMNFQAINKCLYLFKENNTLPKEVDLNRVLNTLKSEYKLSDSEARALIDNTLRIFH
jgi:DNA-binding XRE family transcriptional regulator